MCEKHASDRKSDPRLKIADETPFEAGLHFDHNRPPHIPSLSLSLFLISIYFSNEVTCGGNVRRRGSRSSLMETDILARDKAQGLALRIVPPHV